MRIAFVAYASYKEWVCGTLVVRFAIIVYTDSSLPNLSDGGTQGGYATFIEKEKSLKSVLISWQSQKTKRVIKSTLSADCMACIEGVDSAFLLQEIMNELFNKIVPITVFVDNESLVQSVFMKKKLVPSFHGWIWYI